MKFPSLLRPRLLLPAFGAVALVGLAGAAIAKPGGPGADGKRRGGMCAKLSCTDQQREDLRQVMKEMRADSKGDVEAIRRLHQKMADEFVKDSPDEAVLRATQAEIARHQKELRDRGFDAMMEVHGLLDQEQRVKLAEMIKRRGFPGMKGPRGHGKHGKHGKRGKRGEDAPSTK